MLKETITLTQLIDVMDSGEVFSIGFRTCDRTKKTGGEWIDLETAVKQNYQFNTINPQPKEETGYKKNPNHYANSTRNIRRLPDGQFFKIHLRLIRRFNSKIVM